MKKIAFLVYDINTLAGGEKISIDTASNLTNDYEVYLISALSLENTPYKWNEKIKFLSLNLHDGRVLENYLKGVGPLIKILKQFHIEQLFLIGTNVSLFSIIKFICRKTRFIYSDHACLKGTLSDKKATFIRKLSHKLCHLTILLTQKNVQHYIQYLNADQNKLTFIYNPIIPQSISRTYNVNTNRIVSVGRISEEKGYDLLIKVASHLKELNPNWHWDIYGDGPLKSQVQSDIEKYNLSEHVFLKGITNAIMEKYNDYGIFVLTSYREGLPLVLLEAKSCHLPIVSFDIDTGPDEIVRDGINGYLVEPYDVKDMASKINDLLLNQNLKETFSKNASYDLEKFDANQIYQKWKNVIEKKDE